MSRNEGYRRVCQRFLSCCDATSNTNSNRFEYLWQDSEAYKRPTKMSAPEYVEHLMAWVQGNIDNEQLFPSRTGNSNIPNFVQDSKLTCLTKFRCCIPQIIPISDPPNVQTPVSCVRAHLLSPLSRHPESRPWAAPQYQLQALRPLHWRTQSFKWQGFLGPAGRFGRKHAAEWLRWVPGGMNEFYTTNYVHGLVLHGIMGLCGFLFFKHLCVWRLGYHI